MKDEVLKKLNNTDSSVIPRYNIVAPDGTVIGSRVQIILQNTVLEQGTPLNKANLLSDDTSIALGLDPATSTPDEALRLLGKILNSITPKLAVEYLVGSTVYVKNMTTNETVSQVIPLTGTDRGFASFNIYEFNGYEYWATYNGVSTSHDWIMIDTAKIYEVDIA